MRTDRISAFWEKRRFGAAMKMNIGSNGEGTPAELCATIGGFSKSSAPRTALRLPTDGVQYKVLKTALDRLAAAAILPVVFLPCVLVAVLIKLSSPGPIFFRHRRVGTDGRPFLLWKFRTMANASDEALLRHLAMNSEARREWARYQKLRIDPRITLIGRLLRKTNLDELPQLLNVLAGEMSLVGPRPVIEKELERYGAGGSLYIAAKPGMTGLWQVSGRGSLPYERRVALDVQYVATWSLWSDVLVLLRTFGAVWNARGAY